jgi:hypothetical protein
MFNRNMSTTTVGCTFQQKQFQLERRRFMDYLDSASTISNCTFTNNSAMCYGGALDFIGSGASVVTNCLFTGNYTIQYYGGAVEIGQSCEPTFKHCTFYGNHAAQKGGALFSYFDGATLINCILWGNTAGLDSPEVTILNGSGPHFSHSDIAGCGGSGAWNTSIGVDDGGNIDDDPLFVDPAGADGALGTEDDNVRLGFLSPYRRRANA